MRLKLDENLGYRTARILRDAGHDVATTHEQRLCGASDPEIIDACRSERRCLVTLDMEFGNPLLFRPSDYAGIALLRLPHRPIPNDLEETAQTLVRGLGSRSIAGKLWVIQRGRIREYQPDDQG